MRIRPARLAQYLFLALFLYLFTRTEYRGSDQINAAVNAFFRADPLVLAGYLLAERAFSWLLLPALLLLAVTFLLGRFFCGWICPLGTVIDLITRRIPKVTTPRILLGGIRFWLLFGLLGAALAGVNLVGLVDPIAILLRGLTFFIHPVIGDAARQGWVGLYRLLGDGRDVIDPVYRFLRDFFLPFRKTSYPLALLSLALLVVVVLLERFGQRTWCRTLCPLGTLLGLAGRFSLVRRHTGAPCQGCGSCHDRCPSPAGPDRPQGEACFRCFACVQECPQKLVRFNVGSPGQERSVQPERRVLLGGILAGLLLAQGVRFREPAARALLLRPPGVRDEREFLHRCVRCGECMKVCLRSALYPTIGQAGLEGLYTPRLVPRLGYCEYDCTLCGQVCPTGAIPNLPVAEKRRAVIGTAVFVKDLCLPYAKGVSCNVCEEHCPIPHKAIRTEPVTVLDRQGREVRLKRPYVVDELCNGCGICEHVCPLEGRVGIEVTASRAGQKTLNRPAVDAGVMLPYGSSAGDDTPN